MARTRWPNAASNPAPVPTDVKRTAQTAPSEAVERTVTGGGASIIGWPKRIALSVAAASFGATHGIDDTGALLLRLRQVSTVIDVNAPTSRPSVADLPSEVS